MKKLFLRAGACAGLAMSVIALASCGESNATTTKTTTKTTEPIATVATLKDADGKEYSISATADSDAVSKALVLAGNAQENAEKLYAFGAEFTANANLSTSVYGICGTAKSKVNGSFGVTIGNTKYTKYTKGENGYSEEDITKATAELNAGLGFLATVSTEMKYENWSVDESKLPEGTDDATKKEMNDYISAINNKTATANAKAFYSNEYVYGEVTADLPKEIVDLFPGSGVSEKVELYGKLDSHYGQNAPEIANALLTYQEKGVEGILEAYGEGISKVTESLPLPVDVVLQAPKFDAAFFESEEFKQMSKVVKALGVKISEVKNNNITFALELTGKSLKDTLETVGLGSFNTFLSTQISDDVKLLNVSVTFDVTNNRLVQLKVSTEAVDSIYKLVASVLTMYLQQMNSGLRMISAGSLPVDALSGSFDVTVDFKYNADVNAKETPDPNKTYKG